jgi:hypothetical protein
LKKIHTLLAISAITILSGCNSQDERDRDAVNEQQTHYGNVQPIPRFDYSIPRDVLIQIYRVVTSEARATYTAVESITGVTRWRCPSISFGIPVDTQLTNPLQKIKGAEAVIEQAEPNGLFSSKNTNGTWVLCVDFNGDIAPAYFEHAVNTWPFMVKKNEEGEWVRADQKPASFKIDLKHQAERVKNELKLRDKEEADALKDNMK